MKQKINILSLYGGIECGLPALINKFDIQNYYSFEIDKYACDITRYNYPFVQQMGDINNLANITLSNIDMIIGGSPCTYWSIAKTANRETTSSGIGYDLFMHYANAVKKYNPKYFIYENNFSIHQNIKDAISKELGVQPIVINSNLVSAQNRKRCYWTNIPNITQPKDEHIFLKDIIENTVDGKYSINSTALPRYIKNDVPKGLKSLNDKSHTVTASIHKGYGNDGCTVIEDNNKHYRRLTPTECEALQTLPKNFIKFGKNINNKVYEISDTQRYKGIENGWTTKIIEHLISFI